MWIFSTQGFYSAVEHRADPDRVIVRCRAREDLDALRTQIPDLEPFEDPTADYRWRAIVSREEWLAAVADLTAAVDYDNFKNAVAARQGLGRAGRYGRVWGEMLGLEDFE